MSHFHVIFRQKIRQDLDKNIVEFMDVLLKKPTRASITTDLPAKLTFILA